MSQLVNGHDDPTSNGRLRAARSKGMGEAEPAPGKAPTQAPQKHQGALDLAQQSQARPAQKRAKHQSPGVPSRSKAPKISPDKAHHRLSFGEELEEEEATPRTSFSLAQSTANRFQEERRQWVPNSIALPPLPAEGSMEAVAAVASGAPQLPTPRLGPIACGVSQTRGPRPYMEDRYTFIADYLPTGAAHQAIPDDIQRSFAAVYDGHNGAASAEYASTRLHALLAQQPALRECRGGESNGGGSLQWGPASMSKVVEEAAAMKAALQHTFEVLDTEILDRARAEQGRDGSTVVVVLRIGEKLWAAHAGDSRAVLARDGGSLCMTQDHKPELKGEKARVEENGGKVEFQRVWRVICPAADGRPASGLAVSRSLGDLDFKEPARYVSAEPEVTWFQLKPLQDEFAILASDGLWDVLSNSEAVEIVKETLAQSGWKSESARSRLTAIAKQAADVLVEKAVAKRSMDNITALVLLFQWH